MRTVACGLLWNVFVCCLVNGELKYEAEVSPTFTQCLWCSVLYFFDNHSFKCEFGFSTVTGGFSCVGPVSVHLCVQFLSQVTFNGICGEGGKKK